MSASGSSACAQQQEPFDPASKTFRDPKAAALAEAVCHGRGDEIRRLVAGGVPPNVKGGRGGFTPLLWGMECDNLDGAKAMLDAGADLHFVTDDGYSALTVAAGLTNSRMTQMLLDRGADPNGYPPESYSSPLTAALGIGIEKDSWDNYYLLLKAGADINKPFNNGETIAIRAVNLGWPSKAFELVKMGAKRSLDDLYAYALSLRVAPDHPEARARNELIELLKSKGVKPTKLK